MALNLKSDEAHRLAREIAHATGTSLTGAVLDALREKRARVDDLEGRRVQVERLLSYGERLGVREATADKASRGDDVLFDDPLGLPG